MMFALTLALSRLVPILFGASLVLVAGRFLYDRYRQASPLLGRVMLIAVYGLGAVGSFPYITSSAALVTAEFWFSLDDWERTEHYFALHERLGGSLVDATAHDRVLALMNSGRYEEAEEVILSRIPRTEGRVTTSPEVIYLLGISRYHQGRWQHAERALAALEDHPAFILKRYYLGRLSERRGDPEGAIENYRRALELEPHFFAALYQGVRLLVASGDTSAAGRLLAAFPDRDSTKWPLLPALERSVSGAGQLPDNEFPLLILSD